MDLDSLKAVWFINEASKLNPNDPKSNGYGFAAAVLVGIVVILLAYIFWKEKGADKRIRSLQSDREQYRAKYLDALESKFAKVYDTIDKFNQSIAATIKDLREECDSADSNNRDRIEAIGRDLAGLKGQLDAFFGQPRNRGSKT